MAGFIGFLRERLEAGGFSTEDTLVTLLPIMRQVFETHRTGRVAPLAGCEQLHVEDNKLWFEDSSRKPPELNWSEIHRVLGSQTAAVEVVGASRKTVSVGEDHRESQDLSLVTDDESPIERPCYRLHYRSWEHQLGHHDPLTDIFSLGMLLASVSCGLDFTRVDDLKRFAEHRKNLFELQPQLHPVVAQAIVRMTELNRHRRSQDLKSIIQSLENYREQRVDFDIDLARVKGFQQEDSKTKQSVLLRTLRDRLFEITRRNRLLHFRATMQTVNLTQASIPLSFDIENIRPDQLVMWNEAFASELLKGKPISLNQKLNFSEAIYLPHILQRTITEARRDAAEYGFAQLRLVIGFLRWANFKETPVEHYESPLILLPVSLKKKRGIQDTFLLQTLSSEAEINPVIRHQFQVLYDISLPESIDLDETNVDEFYQYLVQQIEAKGTGVSLNKIDKPRISLIYEKAKRKLDHYRRKARLAGRGVRNFLDIDYSYDPANYHPLGIKLFSSKIRTPTTNLREVVQERPTPQQFAVPDDAAAAQDEPRVVEKEKVFYQREEGSQNPYEWELDLCNVTLSNFKYRRMSLVRDYDQLLEEPQDNDAFEATFSLTPRPLSDEQLDQSPLEDRFHVVPCDPTQGMAIEQARRQESYIIQGPPGTGKSQTITNLIADFVARGRRVLFVCEKRAAIDVVYARLKQCGLAPLCCLIHDSQADKKAFVMNLKDTYQSFLAPLKRRDKGDQPTTQKRGQILKHMRRQLEPLDGFDSWMRSEPTDVGGSIYQLLDRCVQFSSMTPELDPIEKERLPNYSEWREHLEILEDYQANVEHFVESRILADHPLGMLSMELSYVEHPAEFIDKHAEQLQRQLEKLITALEASSIDVSHWADLDKTADLMRYVSNMKPVLKAQQIELLDPDSDRAQRFLVDLRKYRGGKAEVEQARQENENWKQKIPERDLPAAIAQAETLSNSFLPWLRPSWWRLRSVMNHSYNFTAHVVRPSWSQVLENLRSEYEQVAKLAKQREEISETYRIAEDVEGFVEAVHSLRERTDDWPENIQQLNRELISSKEETGLASLVPSLETWDDCKQLLEKLCEAWPQHSLPELLERLQQVRDNLELVPEFLSLVAPLKSLPESLRKAIQYTELAPEPLEAAIANKTLEVEYARARPESRFHETQRQQHVGELKELYAQWLSINADEVLSRVKKRFLENVKLSEASTAELGDEEKQFKKVYNTGRRELEHEFGKSMRYKSIRDLLSGETGKVVRDLKPVWLMSPLSVSDTLPLGNESIDVVIFDEASQITLEDAIPSLFRVEQAIVVGDDKQLPPTDFFATKKSDEEEALEFEHDGETVSYELESNSLLNHAAKNLSSTMLGWHYRSRSESLISFSNWAFYQGNLLSVPEENLPGEEAEPLIATTSDEAREFVERITERPITFHFMDKGVYEKRRNRMEADYIAELVRSLLASEERLSIGVVAFSEAQQDEIESALNRLAQDDTKFRNRLEEEWEREEDGQFVGLLVKNLENIQGDERDIIILSVCYGYSPAGKMLMNFGPINKSGGEKRLNVAFTRAKQHMVVVSSITYVDITNDYNEGANCLKNYLRYAEAVSSGDEASAHQVLQTMANFYEAGNGEDDAEPNQAARQIAAALQQKGLVVDFAVGQSKFRCDLAVRAPDQDYYALGITCDSDQFYAPCDRLERDMMKPTLLENFGWSVEHVMTKDWYDDPEKVLERLAARLE